MIIIVNCVTTLKKLKRNIKKAYIKKTFSCNHISILSSNAVQKLYLEIWHIVKFRLLKYTNYINYFQKCLGNYRRWLMSRKQINSSTVFMHVREKTSSSVLSNIIHVNKAFFLWLHENTKHLPKLTTLLYLSL